MDQKAYSEYRVNGDLAKVIEGIRNVDAARNRFNSPMKLELQFLVNRHNEHQIAEAERFAREVKAQLKLKSMQVINGQDAGEWMPSDKEYARYEKSGGKYAIRNSMPSGCLRLWLNPVITWDGKVLPCCFDKDAEFVMGDLKKDSFRTIWNGTDYNEFRKRVLSGKKIDSNLQELHIRNERYQILEVRLSSHLFPLQPLPYRPLPNSHASSPGYFQWHLSQYLREDRLSAFF